jgi:hypothetical protein
LHPTKQELQKNNPSSSSRCVKLEFCPDEREAYGVIPMQWVLQCCQILPLLNSKKLENGDYGEYYVNKYFWGACE